MINSDDIPLAGSGLNRAAHLRAQPQALQRARANGHVLLWDQSKLVLQDARLWTLPGDHPALSQTPLHFLGLTSRGAYFVAPLPAALAPLQGAAPQDLRTVMADLDPLDSSIAATATGLMAWHDTHQFCANCGAATKTQDAGWRRQCDHCGRAQFPRTDPVVIMLVTQGERLLVGRAPGWPEGMFSLLAGFVETGESIEAAVRREVFEEVGVRCGAVRYLASQPWPFPASLMLGCQTEALDSAITLDPAEIENAMWVERAEMMTVMAGTHPTMKAPRKGAIASVLIQSWLANRLYVSSPQMLRTESRPNEA